MKSKTWFSVSMAVGLALVLVTGVLMVRRTQAQESGPQAPQSPQAVVGTAFTYQGRLEKDGAPVDGVSCAFTFDLYAAASGESPLASDSESAQVSDGFFSAVVDFGNDAFIGEARWLEISVQCPGDGAPVPLDDNRVALNPAPYALALPGMWTQQNATSPNVIGGYSGNIINAQYGATIGGGGSGAGYNLVNTNYGTVGGGLDNHVNGQYATVGGGQTNRAYNESTTIGGGDHNQTFGSHAAIGGGRYNTAYTYTVVSGGDQNHATGQWATIGGGTVNEASGRSSTIGGGSTNIASHNETTVGGGVGNVASNAGATVGGGQANTASGSTSTVGGGFLNVASGGEATVGGGWGNGASGAFAAVGGGIHISVTGAAATAAGGDTITVTGNYAAVGGGQYNIASGNYATVPGGVQAEASHYGEVAHASGSFDQAGDAQGSSYVLRATTSDDTPTELFLDGDGGSQRLTIPQDRTVVFDILIVGRSGYPWSAGYTAQGIIEGWSGGVNFVGAPPTATVLADALGSSVSIMAENNALVIKVTGPSGQTVRWVATVRTAEVSW